MKQNYLSFNTCIFTVKILMLLADIIILVGMDRIGNRCFRLIHFYFSEIFIVF